MKITIYELLGMVKDDNAPKKIKYDNDIYEYDYNEKNYTYFFIDHYRYLFDEEIMQILDDEVEVIEEKPIGKLFDEVVRIKTELGLNFQEDSKEDNKKIEELPYYSLEKIQKAKNKGEWREERISLLEKRINDYHIKINEIINKLNEVLNDKD